MGTAVSRVHLLFTFFVVRNGSWFRCTRSAIGAASLIVSNMLALDWCALAFLISRKWRTGLYGIRNTLTLDGSKLFPVCICLGESKLFPACSCFLISVTWWMDFCCVAQAVALHLWRALSATRWHRRVKVVSSAQLLGWSEIVSSVHWLFKTLWRKGWLFVWLLNQWNCIWASNRLTPDRWNLFSVCICLEESKLFPVRKCF